MGKKLKKALFIIANSIVSVALVIGFWCFGFFTGNGELKIYIPIAAACGAFVIIAVIANSVLSRKLISKFNGMKISEIYDYAYKIKADVENDYSAAEKSVKMTIVYAYVYICILIAVHCLFCFAVGGMKTGPATNAVLILLACYSLWGLVNIFFTFQECDCTPPENEIPQDKYPLLYETVNRAARKSGYKKQVKLYFTTNGISVSMQHRKIVIFIDYMEFAVLTAEELYNVMLHEFAHVTNADSKRGAFFSREEERWDKVSHSGNPLTLISRSLVLYHTAKILLKTNFYYFFATRHHEILADEAVKKLGSPQIYANALAKSGMMLKFRDMPCRELEFDFYAPEKLTGDYAKQEYELFFKYRDKYAELWKTQFERELPARVDSHPTFKMRLAAMGCDGYDAYASENNEAYKREQTSFLDFADTVMNAKKSDKYDEYRNRLYLRKKKLFDEYDEAEKSGIPLSNGKLLTVMETLSNIDGDKALKIGEKLLKINPEHAKVNYIMGEILFYRYDIKCLDYFKIARKDNVFTDDAMDYMGRFALLYGDENLLKEYRNNITDVMQKAKDDDDDLEINSKTEITAANFTDSEKSNIYGGLREAAGEDLLCVYIGEFKSKSGENYYAVVPVFKSGYDTKNYNTYMVATDNFLSMFTDRKFILINDDSPTAKLVKNVDGTKI